MYGIRTGRQNARKREYSYQNCSVAIRQHKTDLRGDNHRCSGCQVGNKGYFVASDAWMDEYTYQIVVRKEFLTAAELAAYEAEPLVLAPWDPMGALAL